MKLAAVLVWAALMALVVAPFAATAHTGIAGRTTVGAPAFVHSSSPTVAAVAPGHGSTAIPTHQSGYPRTVLVEAFTGEWCPYCVMESQAMYAIDHSIAPNVITIGEVHVCYSSSSCGDNYISADSTTTTRTNYYGVNAFPTVFFDGGHVMVGAANTLADLETTYNQSIAAASSVPGNVSIAQTATISSSGSVDAQSTITSATNGSYRAIMYLVEFIGKNDSSHHDIDWVIRSTMVDQTVALTPGGTVTVTGTGTIGPTWNQQHLYVISFVQDYGTKIVQNANMVPVRTMSTVVTSSAPMTYSGHTVNVTVQVANSSTAAPVAGATVTLSSDQGGTFTPVSGVTDGNGMFTAAFTAPQVSQLTTFVLTATVAQTGYTEGLGTVSVVVNPLAPPTAPLILTLVPNNATVVLNWLPPSSGGGGVTYHIFRSTVSTSGFAEIGVSSGTSYTDSGLSVGQKYWYQVAAQNAAGFSTNASAVTADPLVAMASGLPPSVGWWLSIDSATFQATTNTTFDLHLPDGSYTYEYGAYSYGYLAPNGGGTLTVPTGTPTIFTAAFEPRLAVLQGTVTPVTATVTVNGLPVAVSNGAFLDRLVEGTYVVETSSPDYTTNTSTVVLTAGNTTALSVDLNPVAGPAGGGSGAAALSSAELGAILGGAAVVGLALVVTGVLLSRRSRARGGSPPNRSSPRNP